MTKYILYCAQEANFATRSMIIPYDRYLESPSLKDRLDMLRRHSSPKTFTLDGEDYHIPNLITKNITWKDGCGSSDDTEYIGAIGDLTRIADGFFHECDDEGRPFYMGAEEDRYWTEGSKYNLAGGFNNFDNVKNFCELYNMKEYKGEPVEIVEGFLVLETYNGEFRHPPVDTVQEMFKKYYNVDYKMNN